MSWLALEASDVWLFRDGRPFDAGSDHRARSLFPPNPSTLCGALRSAILVRSGASLAEFARGNAGCRDEAARRVSAVIGWPGTPPSFTMRGPFVARRKDGVWHPLFPAPASLVKPTEGQGVASLAPLRDGHFEFGWPDEGLLPLWSRRADRLEEASGWRWLTAEALEIWLRDGTLTESGVLAEHQLFARESRFGVALDHRVRRPVEGLLYTAEFIRPRQDVGLLVEVSGLDLRAYLGRTGTVALGGEARAARYDVIESVSLPPSRFPPPDADGKTLAKLYLATPAWFEEGWRPARWDRWVRGERVRLVAAAMAGAEAIGGARVDLRSQREGFQQSARRFVPAGSVFFLEVDGPAEYTGEPLGDRVEDGGVGFGRAFVGSWTYA